MTLWHCKMDEEIKKILEETKAWAARDPAAANAWARIKREQIIKMLRDRGISEEEIEWLQNGAGARPT